MNGRVVIVVTLILGLGFIGLFLELEKAGGAAIMTLMASKIKRAPTGLDDPIWQKAKGIQVPLEGKAKFAEKKLIVTACFCKYHVLMELKACLWKTTVNEKTCILFDIT